MRKFRITNTISGFEMGVFEAEDENQAYLAMVREAGHASIEESNEVAPTEEGEILIEEIK